MDWIERGIWYLYTGLILAEITRFAPETQKYTYVLMLLTWPLLAPAAILAFHFKLGGKK